MGSCQLHAAFLRSDRAHAEIASLDLSAARAAPGVIAVLTGADARAAGYCRTPILLPYKGRGGEALKVPPRPVLAHGRARYVGEPVALVVAETAAAAQDAVELIPVDYRTLPAVVDAEAALAPEAPEIHAEIPGNLCFDYEYGDAADRVEAAFAGAAHVVRLALESARVVGNPMEPKAALAAWDGDVLDLWTGTQGMVALRDSLASLTGLVPERIRVRAADVGGGFGIRGAAYPEHAALALAARRVGRPVKWVATRTETFLSDYHGRGVRMQAELALNGEGRFLAIRHAWICDQGAYPVATGPLINTLNPAMMCVGCYRIPLVHGHHRLAVTNTIPITAYRGAGRPDMAYAVERLVDKAARQVGIDRLELRRRNLIPREAFPYRLPTGAAYDSGNYAALLDIAAAEADWAGFERRREQSAGRGRLRGIGCALFVEPSGGVVPRDEAAITVEHGERFLVHVATGSSGQGHETVFPEIAARVLGIAPERIELRASDPDAMPVFGGAFASRSMLSQGSASLIAAQEVVRKGRDLASEALEAGSRRHRIRGRRLPHRGHRSHHCVARSCTSACDGGRAEPAGLPVRARGHARLPVGRACRRGGDRPHNAHHRAVALRGGGRLRRGAERDIAGRADPRRHDAGPRQVFSELCVYDGEGQMLTASFMDYAMPHADLLREVILRDGAVPSPNNALSVKGAGEAGTTGALPTAMNAVLDALHPVGVTHLDMPASPQRVWEGIRAASAQLPDQRGPLSL